MGSFERRFKKQDRDVDWTKNKPLRSYVEKALRHIKPDGMAYRVSVHAVLALVQRRHPPDMDTAKKLADTAVEIWTRRAREEVARLLNDHIAADGADVDKVGSVARFNELLGAVGALAEGSGVTLDTGTQMRVRMPLLPQEEAAARAAGMEVPDQSGPLIEKLPG